MTQSSPKAVGIDLGTTHCAVAHSDVAAAVQSEVITLTQLVSIGRIDSRPVLPSFIYFPPSAEAPLPLPWDSERDFAVGQLAREKSAALPGRVIASAKSWLCHPSADRRAGLLPLRAPEELEKVSPVEASWRLLEHLCEAYDEQHATSSGPLCEQDVVIAVPASFDAAARELTVEAAIAAGIERLTLLEEPQAALYAWLEQQGDGWREQLRCGDVVLVVDIGGGTSDFSAIEVRERDGALELERIAVGDHILLGGDNMDLALAHHLAQKLAADGCELDSWQMASLGHACRQAKERLLEDPERSAAEVALAKRGAKLVGRTLRAQLQREELDALLLDGFFPFVASSARPAARTRVGLTRLGLPYASDPAITKHLAAFLAQGADAGGRDSLRPSCVLFNGGVMRSEMLRQRVRAVVDTWLAAADAPPLRELSGGDLDLAVARGSAAYGRARAGHAIRIRGGTARAYYVGVESAVPAVPGLAPPISLICVAPIGMQEGAAVELAHQLAVVVGEPVRFRFFGSSVRRQDEAGSVLERYSSEQVHELTPIEVTLPAGVRSAAEVVPVRLNASITEVGTLLLEAVPQVAKADDERWKIELSVRGG